jgi:hypothetical protein
MFNLPKGIDDDDNDDILGEVNEYGVDKQEDEWYIKKWHDEQKVTKIWIKGCFPTLN